ncbi:hypothetical protein [Phaeacidiphilus oryzae]|uniref:hypothetical protein n=1 Tax=Phaeacidiphilus oryzae TaxID=348818 RepID=UPI0005653EE9|nr:hypothetical protein [Phaeacidiphilus oryzae]
MSIPIAIALFIVVCILVRTRYVGLGVAVVLTLFGFCLASTGLDSVINGLLHSATGVANHVGH